MLELDPGFEYGLMPSWATQRSTAKPSSGRARLPRQGHSELQLALPAGARVLFLGGESFEAPVLSGGTSSASARQTSRRHRRSGNKEPPDSERSATARQRDWLHRPCRGETATDRSRAQLRPRDRRSRPALDLCRRSSGQRSNPAWPQRLDRVIHKHTHNPVPIGWGQARCPPLSCLMVMLPMVISASLDLRTRELRGHKDSPQLDLTWNRCGSLGADGRSPGCHPYVT